MLSAISLCSRALLKIGASSITSFDDGTCESEIAYNLYDSVKKSLLSSCYWSFAIKTVHLKKESASDEMIALPLDFLRIHSIKNQSYEIRNSAIYVDATEVDLKYIYNVDEKDIPSYFDEVLILKLASEFCLPLTEHTGRAKYLYDRAELELKKSKIIDSTTQFLEENEKVYLLYKKKVSTGCGGCSGCPSMSSNMGEFIGVFSSVKKATDFWNKKYSIDENEVKKLRDEYNRISKIENVQERVSEYQDKISSHPLKDFIHGSFEKNIVVQEVDRQ